MPLATFAMETYADDPCKAFEPILNPENKDKFDRKTLRLMAMMHKAVSVLQFKAEAKIIKRNPSWKMDDRCMLEAIDFNKGTCNIGGKEYKMLDMNFPTVNPDDPSAFTAEEELLMKKLHHSFRVSEKLQRHIKTILSHGCMYAIYNNNLLFHASIPLNEDGSLKQVELRPGEKYAGMELFNETGHLVRLAFANDAPAEEKQYAKDYFMYLWCGPDSCLFDKAKMALAKKIYNATKNAETEDDAYDNLDNEDEENNSEDDVSDMCLCM